MIKLVLIRHGQSMWNLENKFTGWTDVDLSEQGIKAQKRKLAEAEKMNQPTIVVKAENTLVSERKNSR